MRGNRLKFILCDYVDLCGGACMCVWYGYFSTSSATGDVVKSLKSVARWKKYEFIDKKEEEEEWIIIQKASVVKF